METRTALHIITNVLAGFQLDEEFDVDTVCRSGRLTHRYIECGEHNPFTFIAAEMRISYMEAVAYYVSIVGNGWY